MYLIDFITINIFKFYKLKINKFCNRTVLDYFCGIQVYRKISPLLKKNVYVIFDFDNTIFDDSFVEYALSKHLEYYSYKELMEKITFVNISIENHKRVIDILTTSNFYWQDHRYKEKYHENLYKKYDD